NVLHTVAHNGATDALSRSDLDDSDTHLEPLSFPTRRSSDLSFGTLVLGTNGAYTYTLNNGNGSVQALDDGETLTDTFTYAASDSTTATQTTLTVTIFGTNDAPTVQADTNWTKEEGPTSATGNVLQTIAHNAPPAPSGSFSDLADTDADGDTLSTTLVSAGTGSFRSVERRVGGACTSMLNQ